MLGCDGDYRPILPEGGWERAGIEDAGGAEGAERTGWETIGSARGAGDGIGWEKDGARGGV